MMMKGYELILVVNLFGGHQAVIAGFYNKILFIIYEMKRIGACLCHIVFKISCSSN